jgi:hypothetical protein
MAHLRRIAPAILAVLVLLASGAALAADGVASGEWIPSDLIRMLLGLGAPGALGLGGYSLGRVATILDSRLDKGLLIRHEHTLSPETRSLVQDLVREELAARFSKVA